ncbi:GNAT family protein [Hyphomonas sp.]|uniref:GNAT family N-acetyltransferase n=1 Tax=Hyphomonas sp. TaxID=87 RepID=UPI0033428605
MKLAPVTLENEFVRLRPLDPDGDAAAMSALEARAPEIFRLWSHWGYGDWVGRWIENIRERTHNGTMIAFAVVDPASGTFLGTTSYLDPHEVNRGVEVGMTSYAPEAQGTMINPAAKRLLLAHAFDTHGALRVQFQVDERNTRSQAAVLKLGATKEGVLRNHRILQTGYVRNTVLFSILDTEWPATRDRLDARLEATRVGS